MTSEFASADDLFGQPFKRRYTTCTLPVLGKVCRFRSLSENEYEQFQSAQLDKKGQLSRDKMLSAQRSLVALTWCDADGNQILTDSSKLKDLDRADFQVMYDTAMSITGSSDETIEDLVGNSAGDQDAS